VPGVLAAWLLSSKNTVDLPAGRARSAATAAALTASSACDAKAVTLSADETTVAQTSSRHNITAELAAAHLLMHGEVLKA
jgi:hypothetical protein